MSGLGAYSLGQVLTFYANTHLFNSGMAADADASPSFRVYEESTTTPIVTGTMSLLDAANTAGFYSGQVTLSVANGFERGKSYAIYIVATVDNVTATTHHHMTISRYDYPQGSVLSDAGNSSSTFLTDLTEASTDYWKDALILLTSGTLFGQVKKITAYNGSTKFLTVSPAFTAAPAAGTTFILVNR